MSATGRAGGVFVTGTDTGIGKTFVTSALVRALVRRGIAAAGMKPVATGAMRVAGALVNDDALALQAAAGSAPPYADVNPYVFAPPVAPHLAATAADIRIDFEVIHAAWRRLSRHAEFIVVEGVGGWLVPLNETGTVADLARHLDLPVLLVVGLRLGCINHALLTARAIENAGSRLLGYVCSCVDPAYAGVNETVAALQTRIVAPCLGVVPHCARADHEPVDAALAGLAARMHADAIA